MPTRQSRPDHARNSSLRSAFRQLRGIHGKASRSLVAGMWIGLHKSAINSFDARFCAPCKPGPVNLAWPR
jgi:hypothetical protein